MEAEPTASTEAETSYRNTLYRNTLKAGMGGWEERKTGAAPKTSARQTGRGIG